MNNSWNQPSARKPFAVSTPDQVYGRLAYRGAPKTLEQIDKALKQWLRAHVERRS